MPPARGSERSENLPGDVAVAPDAAGRVVAQQLVHRLEVRELASPGRAGAAKRPNMDRISTLFGAAGKPFEVADEARERAVAEQVELDVGDVEGGQPFAARGEQPRRSPRPPRVRSSRRSTGITRSRACSPLTNWNASSDAR